jgi:hypothetical protein
MEITMPTDHTRTNPLLALFILVALVGCDTNPVSDSASTLPDAPEASAQPFAVSGSGVHYFTTAIIHSQEPTDHGMIQRSTDIIELTGDLSGYILYHPTSVFDNEAGTLVNTGTQLFSGTIAGSAPMILHDDAFRFDVDLATGATTGEVYLGRSNDAPTRGGWYECTLDVVGTGLTPEGNGMVDYSGECTPRGNAG